MRRPGRLVSLLLGLAMPWGFPGSAQERAPLNYWTAPPYWAATSTDSRAPLPPTERTDGKDSRPDTVPTAPLAFVGVTPCRVADTRDATFPAGYGPPSLPAGIARSFVVTGRCGIPAEAQAVSFNFTVANTLGQGFLLTYPAGGAVPTVSTLNYLAAQVVANAAVVPLGDLGAISVIPGVSGFDLIVDVNGYYAPQASTAVAAYYRAASQLVVPDTTGQWTLIDFSMKERDTHSAVTTGPYWHFSAPVAGYYQIDVQVTLHYVTGCFIVDVALFAGSSTFWQRATLTPTSDSLHSLRVSRSAWLDAGEAVNVRVNHQCPSSRPLWSDANTNYITITRIGQ